MLAEIDVTPAGSSEKVSVTEAVNALKALQKEGKMLGIITHVSSVIAEIDQKIEVRPTTGGHSVLVGDGITGSGS